MGKKKKKIVQPHLPAGIKVIDTHCHLDMISPGEDIGTTITRAAACGVAPIITVGIDIESAKKSLYGKTEL